MKIGFVIVYVTELKKSLDFYTKKLGMEVDFNDGKNWVAFKSGEDVSLAIERCARHQTRNGSRLVGRYSGVTLVVDDISKAYSRLKKKGVKFTRAPELQHWGGTLADLKDLDGNVLTLMQEASQ